MTRIALQEKVRKLRSKGKTYTEIRKHLNLSTPKSTLSNWCQGVILPSWYADKIRELNRKNFTKAQTMAWASIIHKRELFLDKVRQEAVKVINKLSLEDLKMVLAMLYLGEGAKWKSHSGLMLGSSDPQVILLYISLLEKCYKIKPGQLKCRISYRADQNIRELEKYWSGIAGISKENFYKTKPDPRTIGKKTKKTDYKGVCVISCAGSYVQLELEEIAKLLLEKLKGPVAQR
ncbi:MAG: hypothetical protein Q7K28_03495 [Candidatus Wildermuthbacteria bacterium]|nr:hypothetical protein [Candidatus Wildermuthbacteria bacterium]